MDVEGSRENFLDALYAAAACGSDWKSALASYAQIVHGHSAIFHLYDLKTGVVRAGEWWNLSNDFIARGQSHWFAHEPWFDAGKAKLAKDPTLVRTGFVFHGASEVPQQELFETAWHRDFARDVDADDCLTTTVFHGSQHVLAMATHRGGRLNRSFAREEVTAVRALLQDVRRALSLHLHLAASGEQDAATALWMNAKVPVLLIKERQLLSANIEGNRALGAGDIVSMAGRRIVIGDPLLCEAMHALEKGEARQFSRPAYGRTGSRWLVQAVRFNRLSGTILRKIGADDPAILLILTPLDFSASGREAALNAMQGLTRVERRMAIDLANGLSAIAIAEARSLSIQTVRWHIRNLIEKTSARNLSDLQRILAMLLPI